ncbi:MAG: pentapeptide repeat-containing protein [Pseudomonadota bacterium]
MTEFRRLLADRRNWSPGEQSGGAPQSTWDDLDFRQWVAGALKKHQAHLAEPDSHKPADFSNRDLRGWDFSKIGTGLPLQNVRAVGACLAESKLPGANLRGARLALSDLEGADLTGADLSMADLRGARLDGAILANARLDGVNLGPADLKTDRRTVSREFAQGSHNAGMAGADLSGAKLRKATLTGCDLTGSIFRGADLTGADMAHAIIVDCEFEDAAGADEALAAVNAAVAGGQSIEDLIAAHTLFVKSAGRDGACLSLRERNIEDVAFTSVDLSQARLLDCNFARCDFSGTTLDQADFAGSVLSNCAFTDASAAGVSFRRARLERCSFFGAQIGVLAMTDGVAATAETKLMSSFERAMLIDCRFTDGRKSAILRQPEIRNASADAPSLAQLKDIGIPVPVLRRFTVLA